MSNKTRQHKIDKLDQRYFAEREKLTKPTPAERKRAEAKFWVMFDLLCDQVTSVLSYAMANGINPEDIVPKLVEKVTGHL